MHDLTELHEWHEFYFMLGTSAAALIALLFVAVSLGVGFLTFGRQNATRTFMSPVVVHYSAILVCSAAALAPEHAPLLVFAVVAGSCAIFGFIVAWVTTAAVIKSAQGDTNIVLTDHLAYGALPAMTYCALLVAAIYTAMGRPWALYLLAAALLILMVVNIRNAWDLVLTMVRMQSKRERKPRAR
jgi:hypothetical protein